MFFPNYCILPKLCQFRLGSIQQRLCPLVSMPLQLCPFLGFDFLVILRNQFFCLRDEDDEILSSHAPIHLDFFGSSSSKYLSLFLEGMIQRLVLSNKGVPYLGVSCHSLFFRRCPCSCSSFIRRCPCFIRLALLSHLLFPQFEIPYCRKRRFFFIPFTFMDCCDHSLFVWYPLPVSWWYDLGRTDLLQRSLSLSQSLSLLGCRSWSRSFFRSRLQSLFHLWLRLKDKSLPGFFLLLSQTFHDFLSFHLVFIDLLDLNVNYILLLRFDNPQQFLVNSNILHR